MNLRSILVCCSLLWGCTVAAEGDETEPEGGGGAAGTGGDVAQNGGGVPIGGEGGGPQGGAPAGGGGAGLVGDPCDVDGNPGVCVDVSECVIEGWAPVPGHCPGPADIQCCVELAEGECDPTATPFPNAGLSEAVGSGGCPDGMALVEDFCVDRFEAFLVRLIDDGPVSPYFNPGNTAVRAQSAAGAIPQGYITGVQAAEACENAGKRLCSDAEWLRACQGPASDTYPYGDTLMLGTCNDHRDQHPVVEYFMSTEDWIWSELGHPCINQLPNGLAPAGDYAGCESFEGLFDMMGNLHEWTSNPAGTFRGGFYVDTVVNGPGCLYATTAHDVGHWDYSTGFRCCADP